MGTTESAASPHVKAKMESPRNMGTSLTGSVGIGGENVPDDVYRVSRALYASGLMDAPQRQADNILYNGIIGAQERMDGRLKLDGLINPGGPTQQVFDRLAGQRFVKTADRAAQAGTLEGSQPATGISDSRPVTGDAALNAQMTAVARAADVKAARDKAMQTAGDVTRTGFQQMQDVQRVRKAREAAEAANARARHEEAQRRLREQQGQLQAVQKANKDAQRQATKLREESVQAIKTLGNKAAEAITSFLAPSSRSVGQRPVTNVTTKRPSPAGGSPGIEAETGPSPLTDEVIASNQRLAEALRKRQGVGDLPRFTVDAIHTQGEKAIHEVADLIELVRAKDPVQADELHARTREGLSGDSGTALDRAVAAMHESRNATRPSPGQDHDEDVPSPSVPGPGQDDPDEPDETPDDPGQDDPEDPCAVYEQAVAEAEAEVAELEARADELEREIIELANQVIELERDKKMIVERLQGMAVVYVGAKLHPDPVVDGINKIIGLSDEEFYRERKKLKDEIKEVDEKVIKLRGEMSKQNRIRRSMNSEIAYARGWLAQAEANLRLCEQG